MAIFAPYADKAAEVLEACLRKAVPFACLVPISLMNQAPADESQKETLRATKKIVLLDPELVWVMHGVPEITKHQVHARQILTFGPEPDLLGVLTGPPQFDANTWRPAQEKLFKDKANGYNKNNTVLKKGLWYHSASSTDIRLIVPEEFRDELLTWQHKALLHASGLKVAQALEKHFHWPNLRKEAREAASGCATCAILNAKRAAAHKHFRPKVYNSPRTVWSLDYYGVYPSKQGYCELLGAIDAVTGELRLFPTRERTAAVTTDCILTGIILRDGCPLVIHSDHAREFLAVTQRVLTKILGIKNTTTLGHHPKGNGQIERVWQYVTKALHTMTDAQYSHWEDYIRLLEHTWNTTTKRATGRSPFELAHGLPARSVVDSLVPGPEYHHPASMDSKGIKALSTTARAFEELARQSQVRERTEQAALANSKGGKQTHKVGDKVSFFIPPSAAEAKRAGRKPKHIPYFRGPANITKALSNSSYQIEFRGHTYKRNAAELRKYKSSKLPLELPTANDNSMYDTNLKLNNYIACKDTAHPDDIHYSVAQVVAIDADTNEATLQYYGTRTGNLTQAAWQLLTNWERVSTTEPSEMQHTFKLLDKPTNRYKPVQETISMIEPMQDFSRVAHCDLKLLPSGKLAKVSRVQLKEMGLQHHQLGKTFN